MEIKYVKGDLFKSLPKQEESELNKVIIIPHCCNNINSFGAGFVSALSDVFPEAKKAYHEWHDIDPYFDFRLGKTQLVPVQATIDENLQTYIQIYVANMIGQNNTGIGSRIGDKTIPPVRYGAIAKCMETVRNKCLRLKEKGRNPEIYAPKFCSALAGGNWDTIECLINTIWCDYDIPVTIFYL